MCSRFCQELCEVVDSDAKCQEGFIFPLNVDTSIKKLVINSKTLKSVTKDVSTRCYIIIYS